MPHNQTPVQLSTLRREVLRSLRRMKIEWVKGGWATDLGEEGGVRWIPLPKHLGQVTGCPWNGSSKWRCICYHWVWMDSM